MPSDSPRTEIHFLVPPELQEAARLSPGHFLGVHHHAKCHFSPGNLCITPETGPHLLRQKQPQKSRTWSILLYPGMDSCQESVLWGQKTLGEPTGPQGSGLICPYQGTDCFLGQESAWGQEMLPAVIPGPFPPCNGPRGPRGYLLGRPAFQGGPCPRWSIGLQALGLVLSWSLWGLLLPEA